MKCKRFLSLALSLILVLNVAFVTPISAAEYEDTLALDSKFNTVLVTRANIDAVVVRYNVPAEVAASLKQKLQNNPDIDGVYLGVPYNSEDLVSPKAVINYWGATTVYKGLTMKDWVVGDSMAFTAQTLNMDYLGINALSFAGTIAAYAAGVYLDKVYAFGSAAVTICQFLFGLESNTVSATGSDWVAAAPAFTYRETYTYVETPDGDVLGCKSCWSRLDYVQWTCYSYSLHKTGAETRTYNEVFYSNSYLNRYAVAYQYYPIGANIDTPIVYTIDGYTYFNLQ